MNLILVGMNHKTASVKVRECLAPAAEEVPQQLAKAAALEGIREALIIATCNRVEVLAVAESDQDRAAGRICTWLIEGAGLDPDEALGSLYIHHGSDAVRHLFRVASSLDSLVVGEPQILGQIKDAYRTAARGGTTRTVLNKLLHKTFQVAKRVRTETNIGGAAVSVSYAAVQLAKKIFDDLGGLSALMIGAGEMAELAAEHLMAQGVGKMAVANRTLERAVELAQRYGGGPGSAFGLDDLDQALEQVDIVISSTGASDPVITPELARKSLRARRGRPIFFIDIAVPRDIDPAVAELDGCFVYDIDDLGQVVEKNLANRVQEAKAAERIVAEEVVKFARWLGSLSVVPTITELGAKAEALRLAELERTLKDLGPIPEEEVQAMDRLTKALVKKLLHDPILFLKDQSHGKAKDTRRSQVALLRRIFRLGENGGD